MTGFDNRNSKRPITAEMESEMLALWDDGFNTADIADELTVHESQVEGVLWRLREGRRSNNFVA